MRTRLIDLGGAGWEIGAVPDRAARDISAWDIDAVEQWIPATVPGNVRADLLAAKLIPDPFIGTNNEHSRWVEEHDWWYRRDFPLSLGGEERAFLVFAGIDYFAAIYLDGELLGTHEGMFSRQVYEITSLVRGRTGPHRLTVRLLGPAHFPQRSLNPLQRAWDRLSRHFSAHNTAFTERLNYIKCQMGFGWDFAPAMRTIGIWDDVALVVSGPAWVRDIRIRTSIESGRAALRFSILLDSAVDLAANVQLEIRERDRGDIVLQRDLDVDLHVGPQEVDTTLLLQNPRLWQPWDRGVPFLYDATVRVLRRGDASASPLDACTQPFGIRDVGLVRAADAPPGSEPWLLTINGQPEFMRGANWVPLDAMPGRGTAADYEQLIDLAIDAGINVLRVWGGGLREKAAFYECCDRKGMLVWQEFPFACVFLGYFRRDTAYLALVRQECTEIVRQLRDHPSVALWCGGNEFSPRRNRPLIDVLDDVVATEDGTRPFKRVSPDRQENHNWRVWHGRCPIGDYREERCTVLGEFGLQSVPDVDSLQRFVSDDALWPPGAQWECHNAELEKLWQYARPALPGLQDEEDAANRRSAELESFVVASQHAHAIGLQVAVEHMRRRKGRTAGVLLWQLNEPWPAICWSVIDYYRRPKAAYRKLCAVYNPVLLSALYPLRRYAGGDRLDLELWAINDRLEGVALAVAEAELDGTSILCTEIDLPANSSRCIAGTRVELDHAPQQLVLRLTDAAGVVLSANEYDLTYVDSPGVHWRPYLINRMVELLMRW